ncbi:hypothetical protein VDGL01_11441 [Verticillium dahliae]
MEDMARPPAHDVAVIQFTDTSHPPRQRQGNSRQGVLKQRSMAPPCQRRAPESGNNRAAHVPEETSEVTVVKRSMTSSAAARTRRPTWRTTDFTRELLPICESTIISGVHIFSQRAAPPGTMQREASRWLGGVPESIIRKRILAGPGQKRQAATPWDMRINTSSSTELGTQPFAGPSAPCSSPN